MRIPPKQTDLFGSSKLRAKPRKMMAALDAGNFPDGKTCAIFQCRSCQRKTEWIYATRAETRRGIACETCNA